MKAASARKARFTCILGEEELAGNTVAVKNMVTGEQIQIPRGDAPGVIKHMLASFEE